MHVCRHRFFMISPCSFVYVTPGGYCDVVDFTRIRCDAAIFTLYCSQRLGVIFPESGVRGHEPVRPIESLAGFFASVAPLFAGSEYTFALHACHLLLQCLRDLPVVRWLVGVHGCGFAMGVGLRRACGSWGMPGLVPSSGTALAAGTTCSVHEWLLHVVRETPARFIRYCFADRDPLHKA